MKALAAVACGFVVWYFLGHYVPWTSATAIVLTILGKFGAISYKFVAAVFACGAVQNRL
jgi:hypothetical protein